MGKYNPNLFSYPQTTEVKILREFIKTESHELILTSKKNNLVNIPTAISNVVSWRPEGIKYKKNEIFLDVIEKVNMLMQSNGTVIKSEVIGEIKAKSYLSGMPDCKLGLNDKLISDMKGGGFSDGKYVDLGDLKFHHCVRLSTFENKREISFIPPDGEFELISYRLEMNLRPLFIVEVAITEIKHTKIELYIKAKSNFKKKCVANDVKMFIPVPVDAQKPVFKTGWGNGKATYHSDRDCICWEIKSFSGQKEVIMAANFSLPTVQSPERNNFAKIPIEMEYEIPYYTVSGIQVKYLKISEKSGYVSYPWVRYLTSNGDYHIRSGLQI